MLLLYLYQVVSISDNLCGSTYISHETYQNSSIPPTGMIGNQTLCSFVWPTIVNTSCKL